MGPGTIASNPDLRDALEYDLPSNRTSNVIVASDDTPVIRMNPYRSGQERLVVLRRAHPN